MHLSTELGCVAILFALFVVPRALRRFGRPAPIPSLLLGAATDPLEPIASGPTIDASTGVALVYR